MLDFSGCRFFVITGIPALFSTGKNKVKILFCYIFTKYNALNDIIVIYIYVFNFHYTIYNLYVVLGITVCRAYKTHCVHIMVYIN